MLTNARSRKAILLLVIAFLSIIGCEKIEKELSIAIESTDVQQSFLKSSLTLVSSENPDIIVTTTSDVTDFAGSQQVSDLPGMDGFVSFREAVIAANNAPGPQIIGFNIPKGDVGFDGTVYTIRLNNPNELRIEDDGTIIDGRSQSSFSENSNPFGPEIVLDGSLLSGYMSAFSVISDYNKVIGLVINNMPWGGIAITGSFNTISQCYIGTDETGSDAKDNLIGIAIMNCSNNMILDNLLSGNATWGIQIIESTANIVDGNYIGTDRTGTKPLGNKMWGAVTIQRASDNTIRDNLISGNKSRGLEITESSSNIIEGNLIGTDKTGRKALGNEDWAIWIDRSANNLIGGPDKAARNIISGNSSSAVFILSSNDNHVTGNFIGTDITGTKPIPNNIADKSGAVSFQGDAQRNVVEKNLIAYNLANGIIVGEFETFSPLNNMFTKNSIYSNGQLGIDLGRDGITFNDPGDTDIGNNNLMNYPELTNAKVTKGKLYITGSINTQNPENATIEFFANQVPFPGGDPTLYGEGATFLGSIIPDSQGNISATLPKVAPGTLITATATDGNGNTSEFSAYIEVK